jgi:hypothetical protein
MLTVGLSQQEKKCQATHDGKQLPIKTDLEDRSHFSLWCLLNAPLLAGNDIRTMPEGVRDILTNRELIALGKKLGLPPVATNDCHYLLREQSRAQEVLLCIQTGKTLSDDKRMRMTTDELAAFEALVIAQQQQHGTAGAVSDPVLVHSGEFVHSEAFLRIPDLMGQIGIVTQETILFNDTVAVLAACVPVLL